jgi:solute carrier family 13 (sodium-dependent dicarboxylate transporter), member 2/3/5
MDPSTVGQINDDAVEQRVAPGEQISPAEEKLERYRRLAGAVLAPVAFAAAWLFARGNLSPEGARLAAVLAAVAVLWLCEPIPLPVTALLGALLCVLLGVAPVKDVLAPFADPIIFLFLGSFMLAGAMELHGLDKRIALGFLSAPWVGSHPAFILAGMGLVTALLSMWVSNTATTAMMLPIALGVLGALWEVRVASGQARGAMDARTWPYATGMMLMVAYAASIGGIGTPVGSPPNLIGIGGLRTMTQGKVEISFFRWMSVTVPLLAVMGAALFVLLYMLHPATRGARGTAGVDAERQRLYFARYIRRERAALGPWTRGQVNTLIAFGVAVALWVLPGFMSAYWGDRHPYVKAYNARLPESAVAVLAALLLFILPTDLRRGRFTLTWDRAVRIDWGTILLFGGGLSLGTLMDRTGVAAALGHAVTGHTGHASLWVLTGAAVAAGIVVSEATSNTAAATMLVPVVIASAQASQLNPVAPAIGAVLGASYGFMLPVSTPPNAIVYGSGLVPIPRMIRAGLVFDVVGFFVIWGGLRVLCPMLGMTEPL